MNVTKSNLTSNLFYNAPIYKKLSAMVFENGMFKEHYEPFDAVKLTQLELEQGDLVSFVILNPEICKQVGSMPFVSPRNKNYK
jgi:hypothetical protein